MAERFVIATIGGHRAPWFRELPRLATAGALPIDVLPCVSRAELESHIASGRKLSAVMISASSSVLDRDLLDNTARRGTAVFVVDDLDAARSLAGLDVARVLPVAFGREELLDALETFCAAPTSEAARAGAEPIALHPSPIIAVTGTGGAGASTIACALSQGLAARATDIRANAPTGRAGVLLLDAALHAEQAMLHGTPDVVPGLPELIDAHRVGQPGAAETTSLTYCIDGRGYQLMLGLRRHRDWATLRPRSTQSAITGLRNTYDWIVADVDPDVESEAVTGSADVEDRNLLSRSILGEADVVVVCAVASMKGVHALCRTVDDLIAFGVPVRSIQPIVNHSPRHPRARAELAAAVTRLAAQSVGRSSDLRMPVFVPTRRGIETAHRDATRLPVSLASTVVEAVVGVLAEDITRHDEPMMIVPGTLGLADSA
ncbi:MAG: hypothetical protein AB7V43_10850 [Acidimicrobiia bacterium]